MQFQPGNDAAKKVRLFDAALRRAIAQDDGKKIRAAADKLLDLASEGEAWAIKELADRLDGKSHQSTTVSNEDGSPLFTGIQVTLVSPKAGVS